MSAMLVHSAAVAQEHHERLLRHVDRLPQVADLLDGGSHDDFRAALDDACDFLTELLLPHMEAAERALYPELERMMQNRHSMTPMKREHGEIRTAVEELTGLRDKAHRPPLALNDLIVLRRTVFRLYAMLKVHLAEELLYADIVEHGASVQSEQALATAMEHAGTQRFG